MPKSASVPWMISRVIGSFVCGPLFIVKRPPTTSSTSTFTAYVPVLSVIDIHLNLSARDVCHGEINRPLTDPIPNNTATTNKHITFRNITYLQCFG